MLPVAALVVGGVLALRSPPGVAYDIQPGDDLFATLEKLEAGDEVVIHAGTYRSPGFYEARWDGTDDAPVMVRGAPGEARPVLVGLPDQDIVDLEGSHFTLSHLELRRGGDGLRLGNVDHATFKDLVIHDLEDIGISCNLPGKVCDAVTIRDSEIYDTGKEDHGEGIYLGSHDSRAVFKNGLVEANFVHDMGGSEGDGIEVKPGSFGNTVRDNTIYRTRHPGITVFGFDEVGGRRNLVERNLVWRTLHDGIRIVGQVIVRDNIVLDAGSSGIASIPSRGGVPKDIVITNNTVVAPRRSCLRGDDWDTGTNQLVAGNTFSCRGHKALDFPQGSPAAALAHNVTAGG